MKTPKKAPFFWPLIPVVVEEFKEESLELPSSILDRVELLNNSK